MTAAVTWREKPYTPGALHGELADGAGVVLLEPATCGNCWRWAAWSPRWNDDIRGSGYAVGLDSAKGAALAWLADNGVLEGHVVAEPVRYRGRPAWRIKYPDGSSGLYTEKRAAEDAAAAFNNRRKADDEREDDE